jgi:hypothetical protein
MQLTMSFVAACSILYPILVSAIGPYNSLGDLFQGQLANLSTKPPRNPELGGQDFVRCCALAVNQSLEIDNGNVEFVPGQTILQGNISTFMSYQFPCTASYNGSEGSQLQVIVPYSWCHQNCNGWALTKTSVASDWVEPLIGFVLPTVVFCFTIPRRRSIIIPRKLFPENRLLSFPGNLTLLYKLPIASLLMLLDTTQWLITCVVMAGPMLLSGILEVLLDSRVLEYLGKGRNLSPRKKAHLLLLILIGNLDEDPAWKHSKNFVSLLDDGGKTSENETDDSGKYDGKTKVPKSLERTSPAITIAPLPPPSFPFPQPPEGNPGDSSEARPSWNTQLYTDVMKSRLVALLGSQATFGPSVGIGVMFFLSSFFYTLEQIKSAYGDGYVH